MNTKMDVWIKITTDIPTDQLSLELLPHQVNISTIGHTIHITKQIDLKDDLIETILQICQRYGECEVKAHLSEEKVP